MKTNRDSLVQILSAVSPGLARKDLLAQAQSFVFVGGEVITCNDRVAVHHPLPPELKELHGAVKADETYRILSRMEGDEVDVEMTISDEKVAGSSNALVLRTAKTKAEIKRDAEIKLKFQAIGTPEQWEKIPEGMLEALEFSAFCASTDLSKPLLCHLLIKGDEIAATDNHRVLLRKFKKALKNTLLLPARVVPELLAYAPVEVGVTQGWIHFRNEKGVTYSVRTIDGSYPDLHRFFVDIKGEEIVLPLDLCDGINRVREALDRTADQPLIKVSTTGGVLMATGEGPYATVKERYKIAFQGTLTFFVNADFLFDALKIADKYIVTDARIYLLGEKVGFRHFICLAAPK